MPKPNLEAYDTPPSLLHQDDPHSVHQEIFKSRDEAQQASEPGTVLLQLRVDVRGFPFHVMVIQGPGTDIDEKTVELVRHNRFRPATKDGNPVPATIYLKVRFDPAEK